MATISNFTIQLFWKTNQIMRIPFWAYDLSFMAIRQAVPKIECAQEYLIRN